MRALATGLALVLTLAARPAIAQQAAPSQPPDMKAFASSADVTALIAQAKSERKEGQALVSKPILQLAPYNVNLEYRVAVFSANIHETEAELMYVLDGSATIILGGKLVEEKRTNAANLSGTGIEGGTPRHIAKGDFIMVPEGTAHWLSAIDGSIALMTLHLPHAPAPK